MEIQHALRATFPHEDLDLEIGPAILELSNRKSLIFRLIYARKKPMSIRKRQGLFYLQINPLPGFGRLSRGIEDFHRD